MFEGEMRRHEASIQQAESPEAWLNSNAPSLLRLYPGPNLWTNEALLAETRATWVGASERIEQCERCPATGGACAGHRAPMPEGRVVRLVQAGSELKFTHSGCSRWEVHRERARVAATELPTALIDYPIERVLGDPQNFPLASARQALYEWIALTMKAPQSSLLLTGGVHTDRTRVLASVVREIVRRTRARVHYSWAPRLAIRMREHLDRRDDDDRLSPFERAEAADFLALDFFDPKPQGNKPGWADWFLERMDGLLFERLMHGRVTMLSSPRKLEELQAIFPQAGGFLAPLVVSLDGRNFGQVYG